MTNIREKMKGEQNLRYNMTIWRKKIAFDILNDNGENFTLAQLMNSLVIVNRAIIIVGHWIFDSDYKKTLCLTQEYLDIICSPYIDEEQVATFQSILCCYIHFDTNSSLKRRNMTL